MGAKKREWKAWMVVDKKGKPRTVPLFSETFAKILVMSKSERLIRVRIVEDGNGR